VIGRKAVDIFGSKEIKQMLQILDGKKTLIGVLLVNLPVIADAVSKVISAGGGDPADFLKVAGGVVSVIGILHKFLKG